MPFDRKIIGARFRASRAAANISQEHAAQQLKLSQQTISGWEAGRRMPTITQFGRLAVLYGTPSDYFLFGMETVPLALLRGNGDEQCIRLSSLKAGVRSLLQGWARA